MPIGGSAMLSSRIVKGATLKVYPGTPHGMCSTHNDRVEADLIAFIKSQKKCSAGVRADQLEFLKV